MQNVRVFVAIQLLRIGRDQIHTPNFIQHLFEWKKKSSNLYSRLEPETLVSINTQTNTQAQ